FGKALLQCLACMLPFLDHDLIDNLPYLTASTISIFPMELHEEIMNYLCFYILPFTIQRQDEIGNESAASQSVAAIIMTVFQYSNNAAHHCQLVECLMALKPGVVKDILCVIAYGTAPARASAAKLLFYYWPSFNPNLFDRRAVLVKFATGKVCYDHRISITFAVESPPPLYLCIECANEICREYPKQKFNDILRPMQPVSMVCESKNCKGIKDKQKEPKEQKEEDRSAFSICFSSECTSFNGNHPIRYCQACHNHRHAKKKKYNDPDKDNDGRSSGGGGFGSAFGGHYDPMSLEERQLLGRYGVWLLVGLCTPNKDTPVEILGRLLSMLFHWFHVTAYCFDGQAESALEKLKTEYVCTWLSEVMKTHYEVFISCLLPHPMDYVRVGGHW
ncbi:hypothetical protein DMN91_012942, partial [Ooceraea biroi]